MWLLLASLTLPRGSSSSSAFHILPLAAASAQLASCTFPLAPQLSSKKNKRRETSRVSLRVCLRAIAAAPGNTIVYCVHFFLLPSLSLSLCVSVSLPGEPHAHSSVCLFYVLPLLLLLLSLPHARREILLAPGGSFPPHRPAPAGSCCHWAEGKKRRRSRRRRVGGGAFSFQPPRCNKTNGACIFSSTGLHPPIMSPFFPPPSLPGLKGGRKKEKKKKIRHSTSFSRLRLRFPDVQICLLWV